VLFNDFLLKTNLIGVIKNVWTTRTYLDRMFWDSMSMTLFLAIVMFYFDLKIF
jgi:hypothetical protein